VSRRTGLSRAYLNAIEHGRSRRPGAQVVRRLEDLFGNLVEDVPYEAAVPLGLAEAARERRFSPNEVRILAGMRIRGQQPQSRERWAFILDALVMSEAAETERGQGVPPSS
jgi:transcriptional regulator with XRE-family HTH domain